MAKIDIRTLDDDDVINQIQFGEDETLEIVPDVELDIFYVISGDKRTTIYIDSIDNMIIALNRAKDLWGEWIP